MKKPEGGKKLIKTDLGEFLKLQRKAKNVSRNKVFDDIKVKESTLAHIEKGRIKVPNLDTLYKLSQYYGFDLNVLLRRIEYPGIDFHSRCVDRFVSMKIHHPHFVQSGDLYPRVH